MIIAVVRCHTTEILNNNTFTLIFMNQPQLCDWVCMFLWLFISDLSIPAIYAGENKLWIAA